MSWIVPALLAPAMYAIVSFIDKYLLSKVVKDYNAMPVYTGIVGFIAGTLFWFAAGLPMLPPKDAIIILTTGILTGTSLYVYFRALSMEEASSINIFFQTFPIFSLILSKLFLNETLSVNQYAGFILIFSSGIIMSYEPTSKSKKHFGLSPAFLLILAYNFLWATAGILMKFTSSTNSFKSLVSFESWGVGVGGILLFLFFPNIRKAFLKSTKKMNVKALSIIGLNEGVFVLAKSFTFYAFSIGPVALVSVLETTQSVFALIYGYILTLIAPNTFKEDISKRGLFKKMVAIAFVVVGVLLVNL